MYGITNSVMNPYAISWMYLPANKIICSHYGNSCQNKKEAKPYFNSCEGRTEKYASNLSLICLYILLFLNLYPIVVIILPIG